MSSKKLISFTALTLAAVMTIGTGTVTFAARRNEDATEAETKMETEGATPGREQSGTEAEIASASEMLVPETVTDDGMVPVTADELKDGSYEIEVRSSSSMFEVVSCTLTVEDGNMSAAMTMGGTGYLYVYMGTAEEAAKSSEEERIPFQETEDGKHVFLVPVPSLDEAVECAAFSKRKEKWYARQLCFLADSLPPEAFQEARGIESSALNLADGTYSVEVTLEGGSGRASVTSPTELTMENGNVTARIEWSSSNYDYMVVDGEKYLPVNTEGNSVFEIPVPVFNQAFEVLADTTAMSKPYEIEYKLTFDSDTIKEK